MYDRNRVAQNSEALFQKSGLSSTLVLGDKNLRRINVSVKNVILSFACEQGSVNWVVFDDFGHAEMISVSPTALDPFYVISADKLGGKICSFVLPRSGSNIGEYISHLFGPCGSSPVCKLDIASLPARRAATFLQIAGLTDANWQQGVSLANPLIILVTARTSLAANLTVGAAVRFGDAQGGRIRRMKTTGQYVHLVLDQPVSLSAVAAADGWVEVIPKG